MAGDGAMGLLKRRIVGAAVLAATTLTVTASPATADPTFGVMNAEGGIYWRSAPDWNTPEAIGGNGFYPDTIISVHCYQSGAGNVPGSADTMWEQATDIGGSGSGNGWINEHFINDNQPINQPSPGVPPCNVPASPPETTSGGRIFSIFNAEGGIYYRNSPHWADTSATQGVGVYNGDQVQLICGALGDAIGPYNDTAWSYVNNLSRRVGDGWVNEHFINDSALSNQFVVGEPMCGSNIPGATSSGGGGGSGSGGGGSSGSGGGSGDGGSSSSPFHDGGAIYYSPYDGPNIDYHGGHRNKYAPSGAQRNIDTSVWNARGGCHSVIPSYDGEDAGSRITTVAAWSRSRNVPFALLDANPAPSWLGQINYILLFDPGNTKQYREAKCEPSAAASARLADWLAASPTHRLVVLAGEVVAADKYVGIEKYLFDNAKNYRNKPGQNIRKQIAVCPYPHVSHEDVWIKFRGQINAQAITTGSCPSANGIPKPRGWNP
jgi:uncharacterized membrane protein YgcG